MIAAFFRNVNKKYPSSNKYLPFISLINLIPCMDEIQKTTYNNKAELIDNCITEVKWLKRY